MTSIQTVLILFGGRSAEHEVSLQSAKNVIEAIDRKRFQPVLVGITHEGEWKRFPGVEEAFQNADDPTRISLGDSDDTVCLIRGPEASGLVALGGNSPFQPVDVAFPVLHGTFGEDGTMQGLLQLMGVPFVGAGVLASSVNMDKAVMKRLLVEAEISNARAVVFRDIDEAAAAYSQIVDDLGEIVFVKPAVLGSSVGISRATSEREYQAAVRKAFRYDQKIVVEEAVIGRELECAVLGNEELEASVVAEIIPSEKHGFYSYDAKYVDSDGAKLVAPAELSDLQLSACQEIAKRAYSALCCEGMARVDMFLTPGDEIYINEINTLPGFTNISMYPRLWRLSGIEYPDLISRLIELALERAEREERLERGYDFQG